MTRRGLWGWFLAFVILLGLASITSARVADAHAVLESSSPADQSVLEGSPARVRLTFSEPVTLVTGAIQVFDAQGKRVDSGVAKHGGDATQVVIGLKPDLPTGSYAVSWRVISADSHPVHGGYVFSVRHAGSVRSLDSLVTRSSQPGLEAARAVFTTIGYLGSFIVVGAAVFVVFVQRRRPVDRRFILALQIAVVVSVVAEGLQLPVRAALATGQGLGSLFSNGVLGQVLGQGVAWTIAGVAVAVVAGLCSVLYAGRPGRVGRGLALLAVACLTGAFVVSGHTRSTHPEWLVSVVDAVHVAAAAVWTGGIMALVWSYRGRRRELPPSDPSVAAAEVAGFSRVATVAIGAVAVAGGVLGYLEIRSLHALFATAYGRLVIAKVGLLVALAGLGGFNRFRLLPAIGRRPDRRAGWRYLRRTLRLEALALVAVLGVTGVLVDAIPAQTEVSARAVYSATAKMGPGSINLVIDPARTGRTALHLYILDREGRPDDNEKSAQIALTQTKLGIGPISHELRRAGPGHFVTNGTLFTVPGTWTVTMRVRVDEFTENSAVLTVHVTS